MTGTILVDKILTHRDASRIVLPHLSRAHRGKLEPCEQRPEIDNLLSRGTGSNILSFGRGESDTTLLATAPTDGAAIESHDIACHGAMGIRVSSKIAIDPAVEDILAGRSWVTESRAPVVGATNITTHTLSCSEMSFSQAMQELAKLRVRPSSDMGVQIRSD